MSDSNPDVDATKPATFIREMVDRAGVDDVVIGLSGGIDSTTVAYLAVEALGADRVHGYNLPSDVNRGSNMSDAERVAESLGISFETVELDPVLGAYETATPDLVEDDLARANLQARIRASVLYLHANANDALVLGTGNRTETYVGYYTKYGDGAVDCNPIGHLYKGEVRTLARELGVPEDIVTKPPTAGLWDGQTDEDELGISYEKLDAVLRLVIDEGVDDVDELTNAVEGVSEDQVSRVLELNSTSEHKREMPPVPSR